MRGPLAAGTTSLIQRAMADVHDEFEPGDHFHLGGAKAEYLEVWVLSRSEAEDYWDGNWLSCEVRLSLGGFRGQFSAYFRGPA